MKTCMNIEFKVKKFKLFFKNIKENGEIPLLNRYYKIYIVTDLGSYLETLLTYTVL